MALLTGNEIIEIAIRLEESGEQFYTTAAQRATSAACRALFEDLAEQERHHRRAFQRISRDLIELALAPDQWEQFQAYTGALLQQSFLSKPDNALNLAVNAADERAALHAALGFEKETLLFFHELREVVRGAGQLTVERIIREEKRHVQRLAAMLAD